MRLGDELVQVAEVALPELFGCVVRHLNGPVARGVLEREEHRLGRLAAHCGVPLKELVRLSLVDGDAHQRRACRAPSCTIVSGTRLAPSSGVHTCYAGRCSLCVLALREDGYAHHVVRAKEKHDFCTIWQC